MLDQTRDDQECGTSDTCPGQEHVHYLADGDDAYGGEPELPTFNELLATCYEDLRCLALKLTTRDHARAEDIVHDAVLCAMRAFDRFAPNPEADDIEHAFRSWLYKIVNNNFINTCRQIKNRREVYDDASNHKMGPNKGSTSPSDRCAPSFDVAAPDPRDEVERATGDEVRDAVARLSPHQRVVVEMHYFQEIDVGTIAAELGIARQTVLTRLSRARELMVRHLRGYASDEYGLELKRRRRGKKARSAEAPAQ
jgi:RNA polymerase sigma factor (sigma-70 family)